MAISEVYGLLVRRGINKVFGFVVVNDEKMAQEKGR